jgi:diguanylate cyclase (GGDEF)-like protein/PAS domain S-box-containing protein
MADLYGTTVDALLGKTDADMQLAEAEVAHIRQQDQHVIDTGSELVIPERCITDASGNTRCFRIVKRPLFTSDGPADQVLIVATDITERKQAEETLQQVNEQLQQQATRDALTGLYNRRYLDEMLPREVQRAARRQRLVGLMMLDIDHFKHFNDAYGHDAGDTLLRAMGAFLMAHTRSEDIACRYGGEEFTLVLPGASLSHVQQRAEEIRLGVHTLVVQQGGKPLPAVTVSLGVAVFPDHSDTADGIIKAADQALYQAKRSGRNRVVAAQDVPLTNAEFTWTE